MYISIDSDTPTMHEADDLKSLSVRVSGGTHAAAAVGQVDVDGAHVWLPIASLRALAEATITTDVEAWRAGFDQMLDYAITKGWTSADGTTVRAHIVVEDHRPEPRTGAGT